MKNTDKVVSVVGLGYVGLPLALAFAEEGRKVLGFDISEKKVERLRQGIDDTGELDSKRLTNENISYHTDPEILREADFIIVSVPTPVDDANIPDLTPLEKASALVGKHIKKGATVVFESTVYPGVTEEVCQPIIEEHSGLRVGLDWKIGYSPERINPGDKVHTLQTVVKVVSGMDEESLKDISDLYKSVCKAGVFEASSIKVAEAEKLIENIQRDVNIALMNELAMIFQRMDINTLDVIEAAATKWNFHAYTPGLVGGHCIGVDPYYLVHRSKELSLEANLIAIGRRINDGMAEYVANTVVRHMIQQGKELPKARVLVAGLAFKENVKDFRNSKSADIIASLQKYGVKVEAYDPLIDEHTGHEMLSAPIVNSVSGSYDAIIFPVVHNEFREPAFIDAVKAGLGSEAIVFDVKSGYRGKDEQWQGHVYITL